MNHSAHKMFQRSLLSDASKLAPLTATINEMQFAPNDAPLHPLWYDRADEIPPPLLSQP